MGSDMEEVAFTSILCRQIERTPGLPLVHVPPQLLCSWAMLAEHDRDESADAAMRNWCEEHHQALLSATYIAFHWGQGHYCSLVLNLDVWRRGPPLAAEAAATVSAAPSLLTPRANHRKQQTDQDTAQTAAYARTDSAVPFLHLDTLASGCQFIDATDSSRAPMLLRICRVFNGLYGTTWPTNTTYWIPHVHACGPPKQQDAWSCGYRLLRAWALIFAAGGPLTPLRLDEACAPMTALPMMKLVQETSAQYADESQVSTRMMDAQHCHISAHDAPAHGQLVVLCSCPRHSFP